MQISNASVPLTMDDDHARFWIDQVSGQASMSLRLSNLTSIKLNPPEEPGALGPRGNSELVMNRTGSSPFSVLLEDVSERDDKFLGLSGRIHLDPLPANVTLSLPSSENSDMITIPEFGDADGILALSFFLSGMIDFGSSVNDFANVEYRVQFGTRMMQSPYQDGGYVYLVIPGSGTGTLAEPPALVVADMENPARLHRILVP